MGLQFGALFYWLFYSLLRLGIKYGNDYTLSLPQGIMTLVQSGNAFDFTLELGSISMEYGPDSLNVVFVDGMLFLTRMDVP